MRTMPDLRAAACAERAGKAMDSRFPFDGCCLAAQLSQRPL